MLPPLRWKKKKKLLRIRRRRIPPEIPPARYYYWSRSCHSVSIHIVSSGYPSWEVSSLCHTDRNNRHTSYESQLHPPGGDWTRRIRLFFHWIDHTSLVDTKKTLRRDLLCHREVHRGHPAGHSADYFSENPNVSLLGRPPWFPVRRCVTYHRGRRETGQ